MTSARSNLDGAWDARTDRGAGRRRALALLAAVLLAAAAPAAPLQRDLGLGLHYLRVQQLPQDLPAAGGPKGPTVLDLRYVRADPAGQAALQAWLRFNASLHTPVFVLANRETTPGLVGTFPGPGAIPGLIVVGPDHREFHPDVAVAVPPAEERRAYDALAEGLPVNSLVVETPEKARNDEARLAREHLPDAAADDAPTPTPTRPPQLIDAALQRAVQLHRALLALRRL